MYSKQFSNKSIRLLFCASMGTDYKFMISTAIFGRPATFVCEDLEVQVIVSSLAYRLGMLEYLLSIATTFATTTAMEFWVGVMVHWAFEISTAHAHWPRVPLQPVEAYLGSWFFATFQTHAWVFGVIRKPPVSIRQVLPERKSLSTQDIPFPATCPAPWLWPWPILPVFWRSYEDRRIRMAKNDFTFHLIEHAICSFLHSTSTQPTIELANYLFRLSTNFLLARLFGFRYLGIENFQAP